MNGEHFIVDARGKMTVFSHWRNEILTEGRSERYSDLNSKKHLDFKVTDSLCFILVLPLGRILSRMNWVTFMTLLSSETGQKTLLF